MSIFQKIFSITNEPLMKVIYLFGYRFEISRRKIYESNVKNLKINNNKIVISQFAGNGYGCNPKYIVEEIIRQNLPYELVWLVKDLNNEDLIKDIPKSVRLVPFSSQKAMKEYATAKLWIDNQRKNYFIRKGLIKRKNQYYIQTWHGGLGIKKFDADLAEEQVMPYKDIAQYDSYMIDYLFSNSKFENEVFKSAFWYNGKILQIGHPRNDIFYNDGSKIKEKVFNKLNLLSDTNLVLYAPSFRDDGRLYCFNLEYKKLIKVLSEKFGGNWTILVKLHPRLEEYEDKLIPPNANIINVSAYSDIQELMVASDVLITDYSSCMFDFMLSRKPAFIYASDIDEYNSERGFYYPLEETPFPVAEDNETLINNILNLNLESYKARIEEFLKEKGCIEDGRASERAVELIKQIMEL